MEIYLVRHTTPDISKGICYGQSDLGVAHTFDTETAVVHHKIPVTHISQVYSSPLQRCKLLADTFLKPTIVDRRLQELDFGNWELTAWDAIPQHEINPWMDDFVNIQVPNGESYVMLQERILSFYHSLPLFSEQKIIVVTHAGPMRALLSFLRNVALKDSFDIKIGYGEVVKI